MSVIKSPLKIRTQLIRLLLASLFVVLFVNLIRFYANNMHLEAMVLSGNITDIRLDSERTFRGINDILLTEGTPDSIAIAQKSFQEVRRHLTLMLSKQEEYPELVTIIQSWEKIGDQLTPFFIENNPDITSVDTQVRYGQALSRFEELMEIVEVFNKKSHEKAMQTLLDARYVSIATILFIMIWVYFVYQSLVRQICRPIVELSTELARLSSKSEVGNGKEIHQQARLIEQNFAAAEAGQLEEIAQLGQSTSNLLSQLGKTLHKNSLYTRSLEHESKSLEHETNYDSLTNLPNRKQFRHSLEQAIHFSAQNSTVTAVFFIDLDGFKQVNDRQGHSAGDQLLIEVAHRLQSSFRGKDIVCRLGGDEFGAVIANCENVAMVEMVAQRTIESLGHNFSINGVTLSISCSIGISFYPEDALTATELIDMADTAMYNSKHDGKGQYQFYHAENRTDLFEPVQLKS